MSSIKVIATAGIPDIRIALEFLSKQNKPM